MPFWISILKLNYSGSLNSIVVGLAVDHTQKRCVAEVVYGYAAWIFGAPEQAKQGLTMDKD